MAQISDTAGIPSGAPDVRIGDDYRRVQANPEQFGGLIARGGEQIADHEHKLKERPRWQLSHPVA
jgi:hypothetical protein